MRALFIKLIQKSTDRKTKSQENSIAKTPATVPTNWIRKNKLLQDCYGLIAFPILFIIAILAALGLITITDTAFNLLLIATLPLIAKYRQKK